MLNLDATTGIISNEGGDRSFNEFKKIKLKNS